MLRGQMGGLSLLNDSQTADDTNHSITVEYRMLDSKKVNSDLIAHIRTRYTLGSILIITEDPHIFLSTFRKLWLQETARLQKARASTLDAVKIVKLSQDLLAMQLLRFDAAGAGQNSVNIHIVAAEQFEVLPANCATVYIHSAQGLDWERMEQAITRPVAIVDYSRTSINS